MTENVSAEHDEREFTPLEALEHVCIGRTDWAAYEIVRAFIAQAEEAPPLPADVEAGRYVDVVFDGPPSHEAGRFVEVENENRASIKLGEWVHREDGYWVLRSSPVLAAHAREGEGDTMTAEEIPVADTPTPLEEAERTIQRIAWHKKNLDHHRRLAAQREDEIKERISYNESVLKGLAWQLKQEYGRAETPLPGGGSVRIAKAKGSFVVQDNKAAVAFAKASGCLHTKTEHVYYKDDLRGKLTETDAGLVDPATGELVTWAKIERSDDGLSLSYSLPEEKQP